MPQTALGWRCHSGWAVAVVASGSPATPAVLDRRRLELLDDLLPRQPYHGAAEDGLDLSAAEALIGHVGKRAAEAAAAAILTAVAEFGVCAVGIVGGGRIIPDALERILRSHALLHAAEGDLYEQAIVEGAAQAALPVLMVSPKTIEISPALDGAGKSLGPPWQKDHKLAATAALAALTQRHG
jgi:hypothetical protein